MNNNTNRIPRSATKLDVEFIVKSGNCAENHMIATKDGNGWHGVDDAGKHWSLFTSHLRNPNLCKIKVLA